MKPRLHAVPAANEPLDINALNRAAILERDWRSVHVAGDRNPRIDLPEKRRWGWS